MTIIQFWYLSLMPLVHWMVARWCICSKCIMYYWCCIVNLLFTSLQVVILDHILKILNQVFHSFIWCMLINNLFLLRIQLIYFNIDIFYMKENYILSTSIFFFKKIRRVSKFHLDGDGMWQKGNETILLFGGLFTGHRTSSSHQHMNTPSWHCFI